MESDKIVFCVLYTHQKTKKRKTWQDGSLIVNTQGTKANLLDDKGNQLDALFVRSEQVSVGSELESERYLITIEEKSTIGIPEHTEVKPAYSERQQHYQHGQQTCFPQKRLPLKRKRMGFTVPRPVSKRPAMDDKDDFENTVNPSTNLSKPCTETGILLKESLFSTPIGKGFKSEDILARVFSVYEGGTSHQSVDQNRCIAAVTPVSDPVRSRSPSYFETDSHGDLPTATSVIDESFAPPCHNVDTPQCDYRTTKKTCSPFGLENRDSITIDSMDKQLGHQMQVLSPHSDNQEYSYSTDQKENILHSVEESFASCLQANSTNVEDGNQFENSGGKRSASQILALLGKGKGKFRPPVKLQDHVSENKKPLCPAYHSQEAIASNARVSNKPNFFSDVDVMAVIRQKDDVVFDSCIYPLIDQTNPATVALQSIVPETVSQECPRETDTDTTAPQAPVSDEKSKVHVHDPSCIEDVSSEGQDENLNEPSKSSLYEEQASYSQDRAIQTGNNCEKANFIKVQDRTEINSSCQRDTCQDLKNSSQDSYHLRQNQEGTIWSTKQVEQDRNQNSTSTDNKNTNDGNLDYRYNKLGEDNQTDNTLHDARQARKDGDQDVTKLGTSDQDYMYASQLTWFQGDKGQSVYNINGDSNTCIQNGKDLSDIDQEKTRRKRRSNRRDKDNSNQFDGNQSGGVLDEGMQKDGRRHDVSQHGDKANKNEKAENNQSQNARNSQESQANKCQNDVNLDQQSQDKRSQNGENLHVDEGNQDDKWENDQSQDARKSQESQVNKSQNNANLNEQSQVDRGQNSKSQDDEGQHLDEGNQDEKERNDQTCQSPNDANLDKQTQDKTTQHKNKHVLFERNLDEKGENYQNHYARNSKSRNDKSQHVDERKPNKKGENNQSQFARDLREASQENKHQNYAKLHVDEQSQDERSQNSEYLHVDVGNQDEKGENYQNQYARNSQESQVNKSPNNANLDEHSQDNRGQTNESQHVDGRNQNGKSQNGQRQNDINLDEENKNNRSQNDKSLCEYVSLCDGNQDGESENYQSQSNRTPPKGNPGDKSQKDKNLVEINQGERSQDGASPCLEKQNQDETTDSDHNQNKRNQNDHSPDERKVDDRNISNTNVDEENQGSTSQENKGLPILVHERNHDENMENNQGQNDEIHIVKSPDERNQELGSPNSTRLADKIQDIRILTVEGNEDDVNQNYTNMDEQIQVGENQNMTIINEELDEDYLDERSQCDKSPNEENQEDESLQVDARIQNEKSENETGQNGERSQCDTNQREGNEDIKSVHIDGSNHDENKNDRIKNGRVQDNENLLIDDENYDEKGDNDRSSNDWSEDGTIHKGRHTKNQDVKSGDDINQDNRSRYGKTTENGELENKMSNEEESSQHIISIDLENPLVLKEMQTDTNTWSCSICGALVHCLQDEGLCPECTDQVATGFESSWKSTSQTESAKSSQAQDVEIIRKLPMQSNTHATADNNRGEESTGETNATSAVQWAPSMGSFVEDGHLDGKNKLSTSAINTFDRIVADDLRSPTGNFYEFSPCPEKSLIVGKCDKMSLFHRGNIVEDWLKNVEPYTCTEDKNSDSIVPEIGELLPECDQDTLQKENALYKSETDAPQKLINQDSSQQYSENTVDDVPVEEQCVPVWKNKSQDNDDESVFSIQSGTDSSDSLCIIDGNSQSCLITTSYDHKSEDTTQSQSHYSDMMQSFRSATTWNSLREGFSDGHHHHLSKMWKGLARRDENEMVAQNVEMDVPRTNSLQLEVIRGTNKKNEIDIITADLEHHGCRRQELCKPLQVFHSYPEVFQDSTGNASLVPLRGLDLSSDELSEDWNSTYPKRRDHWTNASELVGQRERGPKKEMYGESDVLLPIQSQSLWIDERMDKLPFHPAKRCHQLTNRFRNMPSFSTRRDFGLELPGLSDLQSFTNNVNSNFSKPSSFQTSTASELNSPCWPMHDRVDQQYSGVHQKPDWHQDILVSERHLEERRRDHEWKMEFHSGEDLSSAELHVYPPNGNDKYPTHKKRMNHFERLLQHSSTQSKIFLSEVDVIPDADNSQLNEKGIKKKKKENYWTNPVSSGTVRRELDIHVPVPTIFKASARREIPPRVFTLISSPIQTDDFLDGISGDHHLHHETRQGNRQQPGSDSFHTWYRQDIQPLHETHSRHCKPSDTFSHVESSAPQAYQELESPSPNHVFRGDKFQSSAFSPYNIHPAETRMPSRKEIRHSYDWISNDALFCSPTQSLFSPTEDASPILSDHSPINWKAGLINWCPTETQNESPALYSRPCHRINAQKRSYPTAATTNTKYKKHCVTPVAEPNCYPSSTTYSSPNFCSQQPNARFMQHPQDATPQISSFLQRQDKVPDTVNRNWHRSRVPDPMLFTPEETDFGNANFSLSEFPQASSSTCDLKFSLEDTKSRTDICVKNQFTHQLEPWLDLSACYDQRNSHLTRSPDFEQDHEHEEWTDSFSQRVPPSQARCSKRRGFQNPTVTVAGEITLSSGRSICSDLFFPSADEVQGALSLRRQVEIPVSFSSVAVYKQVFASALKEHLNIILFELSRHYHSAKDKADLQHLDASAVLSHDRPSGANASPHCEHGNPAKIVCVKKEGANKGRLFYACGAPRASQCKFFKWADQFKGNATDGNLKASGSKRPSLLDPASATVYFKSYNVHLYYGCEFLRRSSSHALMPGAPAWIRKRKREMMEMSKKKLYLRLSRKESSSVYGKDDIWVISKDLTFDPRSTFLARSVYHGPSSNNDVEIEPLAGYSTSNWVSNCIVHAMLACNASSELSCLKNLQEHINAILVPILPVLLSNSWEAPTLAQSRPSTFRCPAPAQNEFRSLSCSSLEIEQIAADMIKRHNLNMDQAAALRRVAMMFQCPTKEGINPVPVTLIHGVFGAGKSFLLAVTVLFLVQLFELNDAQQPDGASQTVPWKLLIASTTNVAVDRILLGLLELGFEEFIRVGSIKKIAKPVLPFSVHASDKDNQEVRDLYEMLKTDLTPTEKHHVRRSIERQRLGRNKDLLGRVRVVGATCAACTFPCMSNLKFPVVLLDECSQMTEPSSLLPIARFQCEKLVLVGDPKQLDPTIQGSEAGHDRSLEQTLFNRLIILGHEPILLRTQYRCHPQISAISNCLFYDQQLIDGVSAEDRPPLAPSLPTLCFYSVSSGKECCASDGSYYNDQEASYVVFMIETLVLLGVEPANIGIITLYKAQVVKINILLQSSKLSSQGNLKAIQISTVDAFQGGEKGVIILSCVRTDYMGFADSDKRTNVALTRSKNHLFIVGNLRILAANNLWGKVIEKCRDDDNGIQSSQAFMKTWSPRLEELLQELKRDKRKRNRRNSEKDQDTRPDCQLTLPLQDGESPSGNVTAQ